MKMLIMAAVTAAALGVAALFPAEAQQFGACGNRPCIRGIIVHPPICVKWVFYHGRRLCVRWLHPG